MVLIVALKKKEATPITTNMKYKGIINSKDFITITLRKDNNYYFTFGQGAVKKHFFQIIILTKTTKPPIRWLVFNLD